MAREPNDLWLFEDDHTSSPYELVITLNYADNHILLEWTDTRTNISAGRVAIRCTGFDELTWELNQQTAFHSSHHRSGIRSRLEHFRKMFPVRAQGVRAGMIPVNRSSGTPKPGPWTAIDLPTDSPWTWLEEQIAVLAAELRTAFSPMAQLINELAAEVGPETFERELRRFERRAKKLEQSAAERARHIREARMRQEEQQRKRDQARRRQLESKPAAAAPAPPARPLLPPVPMSFEVALPPLQQTLLPATDLRSFLLRERAALWWISNQSDDLLCLPYCRIERLEYQIRTALRVLGPLRGRGLLSDEVGLGKTIEAGLVIKEYLTRGMIKRFLVLTVPSLIDQWQEELADKFGLATATTNQPIFRTDNNLFWRQNPFIVASLHTLKQPAQLAIAREIHWDLLVIDEAHYLRNRESQAWQAASSLQRQFMLLLTATPVQNSLEELYNLVTLLQPGQLPSPKEFRARYVDRKRPHQPRQPEELRRLLGQVMVRNTRANAGIKLPPRRAETVLFEPEQAERDFWAGWEAELRQKLETLNPSQASLWGRLLLQAAGSSPAAWARALESFPEATTARAWRDRAPLESSWRKKCQALVPLCASEGGVVIFSQFLATQASLAQDLMAAGVAVSSINGSTPAPQREPITEQFRRNSGALLLTHSGTEGRNLQFCHRLVNFDLPWNPMEIEQRIGRIHRIGQQHPVRVYNLVQAGTLQEHLLEILQEKLNLFELVVGETGLILGDRFSSDEFAEEVFRRWRESGGRVAEAMRALGDELAAAHADYAQVKRLDESLFQQDYESL